MTQSATMLLDKRLARIATAKRREAIALYRGRGVADGRRADMVLAFNGNRYPATDEALRKFQASGIIIRWPQPLKATARIPSSRTEPALAEPALPRVEQAPVPPAASPAILHSERDKWIASNTAPRFRASIPGPYTKVVGNV